MRSLTPALLALILAGLIPAPPAAAAAPVKGASSLPSPWQSYLHDSPLPVTAQISSSLGLDSFLTAAIFARVMDKTALAPEAISGQLPEVQVQMIRQAADAYAGQVFEQVDDLSRSDAQLEKKDLPNLPSALNDLRQIPKLMSEARRRQVEVYKQKADEHFSRRIIETVKSTEKSWQKKEAESSPAEAGPPSAAKRSIWSRFGRLAKAEPQKTTAENPSRDHSAPISKDPQFQDWLKTSGNPNAPFAAKLAENLTWEQANVIATEGGVHFFSAKQGCEHCCIGCIVNAGERLPAKSMSWESFTDSVHALVGMEDALKTILGQRRYPLISWEMVLPFYDTDPMSILLPVKDGSFKTLYDMMQFLHENAGARSGIVTTAASHIKASRGGPWIRG